MTETDEPRVRVTVWMFVLLMLTWILMPYNCKIIPGGPFVSIRGDILTVLLAAGTIAVGLIHFRRSRLCRRLVILTFSGIALFFISVVIFNVVQFATDRYARGPLITW